MDALERLQNNSTPEVAEWKVRIFFWTRSPQVLWSVALMILGIGLCVAWSGGVRGGDADSAEAAAAAELGQAKPDLGKLLGILGQAKGYDVDEEEFEDLVEKSALDHRGKMVAVAYSRSLASNVDEPSAELLYYAHYINPVPFANELVGDIYKKGDLDEKAAGYYQREVQFFQSSAAQEKLVDVLLKENDTGGIRKLAADPRVLGGIPAKQRLAVLAKLHRWGELAQPMMAWERSLMAPIPVAIAIVAGLAWFAIVLQAIQPQSLLGFRTIICMLAVLAGMGSTLPTLFAVYWQEEMMGLKLSGGLMGYLTYYLLGVGPREELIKLLFFLPFVPVLLARRQRLEMLMVAGCVGLGFAVNENLLYFAQAGPAIAFGRFLTANFFHLSLTGLSGLAFCEMCMEPAKKALPFVGILVALTLAHGCYDALMPIVIRRFSPSMILFMLVSLFFFRRLAVLRSGITDQFSMAATLVLGVSILGAVVVVSAAMELGFWPAAGCLMSSAIGLLMAVLMFYFQLTEGMHREELARTPTAF